MKIIGFIILTFFGLFHQKKLHLNEHTNIHIDSNKTVENKSFAIYVAFIDAKASLGSLDNHFSTRAKLIDISSKEFLVGHAGVIIGNGKNGNTEFYDFGRFNAPKKGYGNVRKGGKIKGIFKPINALFNDNGEVKNSQKIVESILRKSSFFSKHNYGSVEYGVYGELNYHKMKKLADEHGDAIYGFDKGATFCAQFVHHVINAGGGNLIDNFAEFLEPFELGIISIFKQHGMNFQTASEQIKQKYPTLPLPEFEVKRIISKFPSLNENNQQLETN